jgi:HEAT repeat protein
MREAASENLAKLTPGALPTGLLIALDDANESCRQAAHQALGKFGEPAVPILAIRLKHQDTSARVAAVRTLKSMPRAMLGGALPALRQAMGDEDPDVRQMALAICEQMVVSVRSAR